MDRLCPGMNNILANVRVDVPGIPGIEFPLVFGTVKGGMFVCLTRKLIVHCNC